MAAAGKHNGDRNVGHYGSFEMVPTWPQSPPTVVETPKLTLNPLGEANPRRSPS